MGGEAHLQQGLSHRSISWTQGLRRQRIGAGRRPASNYCPAKQAGATHKTKNGGEQGSAQHKRLGDAADAKARSEGRATASASDFGVPSYLSRVQTDAGENDGRPFKRIFPLQEAQHETEGNSSQQEATPLQHRTHPATHPLCSLASAPRVRRLWKRAVCSKAGAAMGVSRTPRAGMTISPRRDSVAAPWRNACRPV